MTQQLSNRIAATVVPVASATVSGTVYQVALSYYASANQSSLISGTATKVQMNTQEFDNTSWFDHTTNYRFTPLQAGKYLINAAVSMNNAASITSGNLFIYKNGSLFKILSEFEDSASTTGVICLSGGTIVSFNGSTDYIEIWANQTGTGNWNILGTESETYVSICVVG